MWCWQWWDIIGGPCPESKASSFWVLRNFFVKDQNDLAFYLELDLLPGAGGSHWFETHHYFVISTTWGVVPGQGLLCRTRQLIILARTLFWKCLTTTTNTVNLQKYNYKNWTPWKGLTYIWSNGQDVLSKMQLIGDQWILNLLNHLPEAWPDVELWLTWSKEKVG